MTMQTISAEDQLAVMRLISNYANAIDAGDADAYAGNFLPDGVLENRQGSFQGRPAIKEWVTGLITSGRVGSDPATLRHFVGLPNIEGDSQRCKVTTYCVIFDYTPEVTIRTPLVATYDDTCVKRDGRWFFETRRIIGDLIGPGG